MRPTAASTGWTRSAAPAPSSLFHCAESTSNVGGRVHFVWADEPPKKELWDECRQRSTARHVLIRYITATPKEKVWWSWMPNDFADCEDKPRNGFVEIRSSMFDNKALTPAVLKQKLQAAEKDQRSRAVIFGDYIDLKGECPFPLDKLDLSISETTVRHHLTSIYSKLQVSDRLELIIYAYRNGLAELPM